MKNPLFGPRKGTQFRSDPSGKGPDGAVVSSNDALERSEIVAEREQFVTSSIVLDDIVRNARTDQSLANRTDLLERAASNKTLEWYVNTPLSSSDHEVTSLNFFRSGSFAIETAAVPASASSYYSKQQTYKTLIVKKTASFFDTVVPYSGATVPSAFAAGTGSLVSIVTGSNTPVLSASHINPATIYVSVPQSGRLVNLRVWVEIVHLSGGPGRAYPLGTLGVAIRSPNLRWGHAHPIRNDPLFKESVKSLFEIYPSSSDHYDSLYNRPGNFYRDTFLLWEGPGCVDLSIEDFVAPTSNTDPTSFKTLPCWQRDRGMRTIFSDNAGTKNPRHLFTSDHVAVMDIITMGGDTVGTPISLSSSPSGNWQGSPNLGALANPILGLVPKAYGNGKPWTSDKTIFPATESSQANGSPPIGWLTAPGGVADINEWPTTGSNYGTNTIRPLYPLLDDIFIKKNVGNEVLMFGTNAVPEFPNIKRGTPEAWRGFRPGLRGTEISGTWELLISGPGKTIQQFGLSTDLTETYFRQVRLEFTYTTNRTSNILRTGAIGSAKKAGELFLYSISGSDAIDTSANSGTWDSFVTQIYTTNQPQYEIGKTFDVILNTGSNDNTDYALLYKLSGTLSDISGATPGWLLNNRFSMPMVPESSASLVAYPLSIDAVVPVIGTIDGSRKTLDPESRLSQVADLVNPRMTRGAQAIEIAASSSI